MFNRFKLAPKFTGVLLLVFIFGSSASGLVLSKTLQHRAEARVTAEGVILMESMQAVRRYTDTKIRPLL
ncbi:MAG: histidine kinase, partial [Cyanobacteria bacterium J06636_16]